jgi:hypothetical protein
MSREGVLANEGEQGVVSANADESLNFAMEVASGSAVDEHADGVFESASPGEADALVEPQAVLVPDRSIRKGVEGTRMSVAGEIIEGNEVSEEGAISAWRGEAMEGFEVSDPLGIESAEDELRGVPSAILLKTVKD